MYFFEVSIFRETSYLIFFQIKSEQKGLFPKIYAEFIKEAVVGILRILIRIFWFNYTEAFDALLILQ